MVPTKKRPARPRRPVESRLVTLHHEARQWLIHHPTWSKLYLQGCKSTTGSRSPRSAAKPAFRASRPIVSSAASPAPLLRDRHAAAETRAEARHQGRRPVAPLILRTTFLTALCAEGA